MCCDFLLFTKNSTTCFFSFSFSCAEFPDCWGGDGSQWWPVSSERELWLCPKAQFHERGRETIWPRGTPETGRLPPCCPHGAGTNRKSSPAIYLLFRSLFWRGYCIYVFKVISGQQLPKVNIKEDSIVDPLVRVEIHGVPMDQAKQETRHIENNGTGGALDAYFK